MNTQTLANKDIWRGILTFLTPRDFKHLSLTNKFLYNKTKENEDIIVKQFHAAIIANQDFFLCNIYQNSAYVQVLRGEASRCLGAQNSGLIKAFETSKLQLSNFLGSIFGQDQAVECVRTINDALMRPKLPLLRLKREYQSCETFSIYQNYLNDVYHGLDDESKLHSYDYGMEDDKIFEFSSEHISKFTAVTEQNKDCVLYARWYLTNEIVAATSTQQEADETESPNTKLIRDLSKKICKMELKKRENQRYKKDNKKKAFYEKLATQNALSYKEKEELAAQKSPLVDLYMSLHQTFSNYCKIIYKYLSDIQNPFVFICEYTAKWKNFVTAMQNIGGYLRRFSHLMNQVYEKEFTGYPNHPEFRVWRMMAKIWCNEVFCKLENSIHPLFKSVINGYLNKFSRGVQLINCDVSTTDAIPENFLESEFDVSNAISEFWNSVLDMALNERTIFSLTCVDLRNFGVASNFCSSLHQMVVERCNFFAQAEQLKSCEKFELILDSIDLIEAVVPQNIFPALYEVFVTSLQSVLVEFISEANSMSAEEIVKFIRKEMNSNNHLLKWLSMDSSYVATLKYPTLSDHLELFRRKMTVIEDIQYERERKKLENTSRGFNPFSCEIERTFLDLDRSVNLITLKQCRDVYC